MKYSFAARRKLAVFMCGIVGYTGAQNAASVLLDTLKRLEYRGYDSAGLAVFSSEGITVRKTKGRLENLVHLVEQSPPQGNCGIGHTRWATHGVPSDLNAHPHYTGRVALVHNGIIENYQQLKQELIREGIQFLSDTDTEVAARLMDFLYNGDPVDTLRRACARLEGSYAFAVLFSDHPDTLYAVRLGSPLIAAKGSAENFLASDVTAVLQYTRTYTLINEGEIAAVDRQSIRLWDREGNPREPEFLTAQWSVEQAQKGGYDHFMLKEIHEQPRVLRDTIHPRCSNGLPSFHAQDGIPEGFWSRFDQISIVACGTAMHCGMVGKYLIEQLARVRAECDVASEFRYRNPILSPTSLVILISQSGETADTLAALRLAKERGITTLAVVNVAGSTIAREADYVIHTFAGPEIAVASTKAYSVQLGILYLIAIRLGMASSNLSRERAQELVEGLWNAVGSVEQMLQMGPEIQEYIKRYASLRDLFFLGRGLDYPVAMEGSLKLKEVSYIHCEAYAAGELKHGTISLITDGVPVIALASQTALLPKMISNIKEVRSRGADVLLITRQDAQVEPDIYSKRIDLPDLEDLFMPLPSVVVLQLLAYHTAVLRGCDVDKPRTLAKSVTVEY